MREFPFGKLIAVTGGIAAVFMAAGPAPALGRALEGTAASAPASSGVIAPALAARLATADPDSTIEAVVVLRRQAALSSDAGTSHSARVTTVVRELHRVADASQ